MKIAIGTLTLLLAVPLCAEPILVSTGVSFSEETGLYTYGFAVDNRTGTRTVTDFGILIKPRVFDNQLPVLPHTSPPGWHLVTSVGGPPPVTGTFQEWFYAGIGGVAPGQYLAGFSLTTNIPPKTTGPNYFLFVPGNPSEMLIGSVVAPQLPVEGPDIPALDAIPMLILIALLAVAGVVHQRVR